MISKIFSSFGGLKITAILGGALAAALAWIKIKGLERENENLEEENIMHQKKGHIIDEINKAKKEAEVKKDEALKNNTGVDYMDRL